jgi:hypothetical protein
VRRLLPSRRLPLRPLAVAAAVLLLAGCVHQGGPGVGVKALSADIVFGVPPVKPDATPPGVAPPAGLDESLTTPPLTPPTTGRTRTTLPKAPAAACPDALETAAATQAATGSVANPPEPGRYRWKVSQSQPGGGKKTGFIQRAITNVSPVTSAPNPEHDVDASQPAETRVFTYDLTTFAADGSKRVTTFQVKTGAVNALVDAPVGTTPAAGGEADRGVALAKIVDYDAAGKTTSTFTPQPVVLLLPLYVASNQQFQSVGVDPGGASLVHNATVRSRKTVDACGDLVDGWEVDSTETFTDSAGLATSSSYIYYIATQLGGVLTYERIAPPDGTAAGTSFPDAVTELTLGQLKPSPAGSG